MTVFELTNKKRPFKKGMLFFNSSSNSNRTRGRKCETGEEMMVGNNTMRKGREEMGI